MRRSLFLLLFSALLLPAAAEEGAPHRPAWPEHTLQQAHRIVATWEHEARGVEAEFPAMGLELPADSPADAQADETTEDTVVTCSKAMLFDAAGNNVVYIGNVRVNDPRLSLRAAKRLFIRLPHRELKRTEQEARSSLSAMSDSSPHLGAAAPAEPAAPAAALPEGMQRFILSTEEAVVDTESNHILLYSLAGGQPIIAESGERRFRLTPSADAPAILLADADGNIVLEAADILMSYTDAKGQEIHLHTLGGHLCYNAGARAFALSGQSELRHPQGNIRCSDILLVHLEGEHTVPEDASFMQQFAGADFSGIASLYAKGHVQAEMNAADGQPLGSLQAEELSADARTGLCTLTGDQCALNYSGEYSLQGAQRITLTADGSLSITGRELSGSYRRPSENGHSAVEGTFRTGGLITITPKGDHAEVCLPQGITASDPEADFSCTGEMTATLLPTEGVSAPQLPGSKLNLALARFRTLDRAAASGGITAHRFAPDTHLETAHLQAERAEFDLTQRAAELYGTLSAPIRAAFNGNELEATPDGDNVPHLVLTAAGDAELRGGTITATFTDEKNGTVNARCEHGLRLVRADNRLETDGAAEFRATEAVLTTNGSFRALLVPDPAKADSIFPYSGVRELTTEQGGKLESVKGAMQCSGSIRVCLNTQAKGADVLQSATAEGDVVLAGKEPSGRLIVAKGDRLSVDAATGEKTLTGARVSLSDGVNTHTAAGADAAIRIDAHNNASIRGARNTTDINRIREQIEKQRQKKD